MASNSAGAAAKNLDKPSTPAAKGAPKVKKPRGRPLKNPDSKKNQQPNGHVNGENVSESDNPNRPPSGGPIAPNGAPTGPPGPYGAPYGGYPPPQHGGPPGVRPMMGYPPAGGPPRYSGQAIQQQGGPTPTLNSLLQGGNQVPPGQRMPHPHDPQQQQGMPPYGSAPPGAPHGSYPQPPGPQWSNSGDPYGQYRPSGPRPPYGPPPPQGYHGTPPGAGPYPPQPHQSGMPPGTYPPHSGSGPPPGAQPPYSQPNQPLSGENPVSSASTNTSSANINDNATLGAHDPPPHPGKHEGKPSHVWTPPIQQGKKDSKSGAPGTSLHNSSVNPNTQPLSTPPDPSTSNNTSRPDGLANEDDSGYVNPQNSANLQNNQPSPTGSASSRSMSPAVGTASNAPTGPGSHISTTASGGSHNLPPGAMPPRPPISSGNGPASAYPQQPAMGPPTSQMMYNKMGHPSQGQGPPPNHQMPPYGGQLNPNYPSPHYRMANPGYGPGPYGGPQGNHMSMGGGQYQGFNPGQQPHPQSTWAGPGAPPPGPNASPGGPVKGGMPSRPRHPATGPPPQPYPMRSPHPGQKGYPPGAAPNSFIGTNAPNYNGPGMPPPVSSVSGGPPVSNSGYPAYSSSNGPPAMNNFAANTSSTMLPTSTPSSSSSAPSPVTNSIGPDGVPIHDESSQQSTLSQSSDRSDGRQTPKTPYVAGSGPTASGSAGPAMNYPHQGGPPGSPHSSVPSPGTGSMGSTPGQDGSFRDISSPNWQQHRTVSPAIQYNNLGVSSAGISVGSQPPPSVSPTSGAEASAGCPTDVPTPPIKAVKGTKADSLNRLYEMDEHPERRMFLDRLLSFMEEKGTPITQCPTISKNPLDLFKLYMYTKERGGFMECTKNKTWKEIAAQLGIGASSSGAYTLKKHYGKNLLPFECQYDRGGMDPAPLLAQVEAQTKKKPKNAAQPPPAPSPGSQDSRDSSSNYSGSTPSSQDAYGSGPGSGGYPGPYNSYPPNSGGPQPGDRAASGAPQHSGSFSSGAPNAPYHGGQQYSGPRPQGGTEHYPPQSGYPNAYPQGSGGPRHGWSHQGSSYMAPPNGSTSPGPGWNGTYGNPPRPGYPPPGGPQAPGGPPQQPYSQPPYSEQYQQQKTGSVTAPVSASTPNQGHQPPNHSSASAVTPQAPTVPSSSAQAPPSSGLKPAPVPRAQSPQNDRGFGAINIKPSNEQSRPVILRAQTQQRASSPTQGYNQSSASTSASSYPPKMGVSQPPRPPSYPYISGQSRPPIYPAGPPWQNRYPGPQSYSGNSNSNWTGSGPVNGPRTGQPWSVERPYGPSTQFSSSSSSSWNTPGSMMSKSGTRPPFRPDMRGSMASPRPVMPVGVRGREMVFPPGCVESTPPHMIKRRKHTKADVQPVDGWKLVMALKSGLLMESTWALDVLNILLFDDYAYTYFGLTNMPGLLEALLEHWRSSLIAMFGITEDLEAERSVKVESSVQSLESSFKDKKKVVKSKWWQRQSRRKSVEKRTSEDDSSSELDLGRVKSLDLNDKCSVLNYNFTKRPRFSEEDVEIETKDDELFVCDNPRDWDKLESGMELWSDQWREGGGNTSEHIVSTFTSEMGVVPFVRVLKDLAPKQESDAASTQSKDKDMPEKVEINDNSGDLYNGIKEEPMDVAEQGEKDHEKSEDIVDKIKRLTGIVLCDPDQARQRWEEKLLEDECYMRDEPSLHLVTETQDSIGRRAVCVSTILRNLSFVPGNDFELSKCAAFLKIAGRLLLLFHWYPQRTAKQRNYDRGDEEDNVDSCTSLIGEDEWWWDYLHVIRENVMVVLANISGCLELKNFDEDLIRPILHGLLEWSVSSSSYAQDPFPYLGPHSPVSPQRLAIETLCKMCLHEANVDLLLATPPYTRIQKLTKLLARKLYRYEDQVLREFSINILYYLSGADTGVSRAIATADQTVGLLLGFIEQAEQNAMVVAQQHGVNALRDNPDSMGTSLDMLRRSASTLNNLSKHPDNIPLFVKHEQRLLSLVMSQILDQGVAAILSNVLFNIGQEQLVQKKLKEGTEKKLKEDTASELNQSS